MLVLASASKARQKLLDQIALKHKVIVSDFDETQLYEEDPFLKVNLLAMAKANSVLKKLIKENYALNTFQALLGCDSLFEFEGEIFGKPIDKEQLISRWKRMSGKSGYLHTGHYLLSIKKSKGKLKNFSLEEFCEGVVSTKIEFMNLSNFEINKYASTSEPYNLQEALRLKEMEDSLLKK